LENSDYPLLDDAEFGALKNVRLRKFSSSGPSARGKGFQEFQMLDQWVDSNQDLPQRFLKISGRYRFKNFAAIWDECRGFKCDATILIDQYARSKIALSQLFCVSIDTYRRSLLGLYQQCDDARGDWIERVLYRSFARDNVRSQIFRTEPWLSAVSGSTGLVIQTDPFKQALKQGSRYVNRLFNRNELLFR
jgi:hypothetical protein